MRRIVVSLAVLLMAWLVVADPASAGRRHRAVLLRHMCVLLPNVVPAGVILLPAQYARAEDEAAP